MTEVDLQAVHRPIPAEIYPDVHYTTLGRWVVAGCKEIETGGVPSDQQADMIAYRMDSSRRHLAKLSAEQSSMFDEICEASVPADLQATKTAEASESSWQAWLAEIASDDQLLEYLKWHVDSIESQQHDPEIQEEITAQKSEYKDNIRRGLAEGWLHEAAVDAIDRVDSVPTYIGDVFSTWLDDASARYNRGGEVIFGGAKILSGKGYDNTRCLVKQVAQHEFNHAVLGRLGVRWLNEAMTEHIAQVLQHGKLDEIDPGKRYNYGPPIYKGERLLLRYILNEGLRTVPVELATLAYSEPEGSRDMRKTFDDAVDGAWSHMIPAGESALSQLSMYVGRLERKYMLAGLSSTKAGKQAMEDVNRDLDYQPEMVFGCSPSARAIVMVP